MLPAACCPVLHGGVVASDWMLSPWRRCRVLSSTVPLASEHKSHPQAKLCPCLPHLETSRASEHLAATQGPDEGKPRDPCPLESMGWGTWELSGWEVA